MSLSSVKQIVDQLIGVDPGIAAALHSHEPGDPVESLRDFLLHMEPLCRGNDSREPLPVRAP